VEFYFSWDRRKASSNLRKHGVDFGEASTVFGDPLAQIEWDPDHSELEPRELVLGQATSSRLLVVSFVQRGRAIRIISARLATRHERYDYEEA
jgi:uncharacterized DUF497 family protein